MLLKQEILDTQEKGNQMKIDLRKCTISDVEILSEFAKQNFYEAFAHLNTKEDMQAYLENAFNIDKLSTQLYDVNSETYFLYCDSRLAGYLKINQAPSQTDINDADSLEVERIYVAQDYQGNGLGQFLMDNAIKFAKEHNKKYIWLSVWQKNEKAVIFYRKNDFYESGTHSFIVGNDVQTDYIMRKDL